MAQAIEEESAEQTTNPDEATIHDCKICSQAFSCLQEALKHDLLFHSGRKRSKKMPTNPLKRKVNVVLKTINSEEEKRFRQELEEAIATCNKGYELNVIFTKYRLKLEDSCIIFSRVRGCLEDDLQKVGPLSIVVYGSFACGLALKSSDIDVHISSHNADVSSDVMFKIITKVLYRSKCFSKVFPIRKARVPIIKCVHNSTGFNLDINTSEPYGVHNSKFLNELNKCDPRIHQLMLFMKIWSKSVHISGTFNMTNYCLVTLVIFFLQNSDPPILPSVKILQRNASECSTNGVNFGVNLKGIPFDSTHSIHQLIEGFFKFYHDYDFDNLIIAPYLGKSINRKDFESKAFKYPEYESQLQMFAEKQGDGVEPLHTDKAVCVQDMFCLNINVGKCLSDTNLEYFKKCVDVAYGKYSVPMSKKELYKQLLVEMVEEISGMIEMGSPTHDVRENQETRTVQREAEAESCSSSSSLTFDVTPRQSELKSLSKFTADSLGTKQLWTREYIDAITQIIRDVYKVDMTLNSPTESSKHKKLDETEEGVMHAPTVWSITSYVDLWSQRQMQRNNTTSFMAYQLAQTEKLNAERRQNSNFAVQFNGFISISIVKNYSAIRVQASASNTEVISKKNPLRRFFIALKCIVQNYNLKHRLLELERLNKPPAT